MKILHIITGDLWAGAEAQVFYCLKEMSNESKDTIYVILFSKGELYLRLTKIGITTTIVDESEYSIVTQFIKLKRQLLSIKPDIVHVHDYKTHVLTSLALYFTQTSPKMVRTVHGLTRIPLNSKIVKSYLVFFIENYFFNHCLDCIVAVSQDIETLFKHKYPHTKIVQINNAIEYPLIAINAPAQIRKEFSVPNDVLWIGTAARCVRVKNIQMLIEAARLTRDLKQDIKFMVSIFGDGPLRSHLENLIGQYDLQNIVQMHGHSKDILSIMKAFDVFVLTSKHEGLPISLLEAMALGTVPICTRVGGMQEIIENSKNGFLVELNNAPALAQKIIYLYDHPNQRKIIGINAESRVKEHYSIQKSVQKLLSMYCKIVED